MIGTIGSSKKSVIVKQGMMASLIASLIGKPAQAFKDGRQGKSLPKKTEREWHRRLFRIPFEHGGYFKTADGIVYCRHAETGVITRVIRRVRGKKARAHDKVLRAQMRHAAAVRARQVTA
jgi:hypothetical protein